MQPAGPPLQLRALRWQGRQAAEEVPARQCSSTGTAGDHISSIFSLTVTCVFFFLLLFALPPFQPPPHGSAQLSHCWNLPKALGASSTIPPQPLETAQP